MTKFDVKIRDLRKFKGFIRFPKQFSKKTEESNTHEASSAAESRLTGLSAWIKMKLSLEVLEVLEELELFEVLEVEFESRSRSPRVRSSSDARVNRNRTFI